MQIFVLNNIKFSVQTENKSSLIHGDNSANNLIWISFISGSLWSHFSSIRNQPAATWEIVCQSIIQSLNVDTVASSMSGNVDKSVTVRLFPKTVLARKDKTDKDQNNPMNHWANERKCQLLYVGTKVKRRGLEVKTEWQKVSVIRSPSWSMSWVIRGLIWTRQLSVSFTFSPSSLQTFLCPTQDRKRPEMMDRWTDVWLLSCWQIWNSSILSYSCSIFKSPWK